MGVSLALLAYAGRRAINGVFAGFVPRRTVEGCLCQLHDAGKVTLSVAISFFFSAALSREAPASIALSLVALAFPFYLSAKC